MAKLATPPAPPWIRIVSPDFSFSESSIEHSAVRPVSARAAASTCDRPLDEGCRNEDFFGIGPFSAQLENTEHFIADAQIRDAFAHRTHHAGEIPAEHQGKLLLAVVADSHLPIGAADGSGRSPYFTTSGPPNCSM